MADKNMNFNTNILPSTDLDANLGASDKQWNIYTGRQVSSTYGSDLPSSGVDGQLFYKTTDSNSTWIVDDTDTYSITKSTATASSVTVTATDANEHSLKIGSKLKLFEDAEGGNISIYSPTGKGFQMDAYNDNWIRMYSYDDEGAYKACDFNRLTGDINLSGKIHPNLGWYYEGDNSSTETSPSDYQGTIRWRGLKQNTVLGLTGICTYSYLVGMRGWGDKSGGYATEFAINDYGIYMRKEQSSGTWAAWRKLRDNDGNVFIGGHSSAIGSLANASATITSSKSTWTDGACTLALGAGLWHVTSWVKAAGSGDTGTIILDVSGQAVTNGDGWANYQRSVANYTSSTYQVFKHVTNASSTSDFTLYLNLFNGITSGTTETFYIHMQAYRIL